MQKIVIDTNVLVSSLIQRNYPYHIVVEFFSIITPKEYWTDYMTEQVYRYIIMNSKA